MLISSSSVPEFATSKSPQVGSACGEKTALTSSRRYTDPNRTHATGTTRSECVLLAVEIRTTIHVAALEHNANERPLDHVRNPLKNRWFDALNILYFNRFCQDGEVPRHLDLALSYEYNPSRCGRTTRHAYNQLTMFTISIQTTLSVFALASLGLLISGLRRRHTLPAILESLRIGRWHFFLLGCGVAFVLSSTGHPLQRTGSLQRSLLAIGLTWVGFRAGLDFDFRSLRSLEKQAIGSELLRLGITFISVFGLGVLLSRYVGSTLSIASGAQVVALSAAAIAVSARLTGFISTQTSRPAAPRTGPAAFAANPLALCLLGILFPAVAPNEIRYLGPFLVVGYAPTLVVLLALGLLIGITVDFVLRAHRDGFRCTILAMAACAAFSGPSLQLDLPSIFIGFVGGVWVINTTVRKREFTERAEFASNLVEPLLMGLFGLLLVQGQVTTPSDPGTIVLVAVALILLRVLSRTAGDWIGSLMSKRPGRFRLIREFGWLPMGRNSTAIVLQAAVLPVTFEDTAVLAGLLLAVALSQAIVIPGPIGERRRGGTVNGEQA